MTFDPFNKAAGGKVKIPGDRTNKQPVHCFCKNPECLNESSHEFFVFEAENEVIECPKCGANESPMIGVFSLTHFITRDPMGPIRGMGGLRYKLACDGKRAFIATNTNNEAGTDQPEVVTCPECVKLITEGKVLVKPNFLFAQPTE